MFFSQGLTSPLRIRQASIPWMPTLMDGYFSLKSRQTFQRTTFGRFLFIRFVFSALSFCKIERHFYKDLSKKSSHTCLCEILITREIYKGENGSGK